MEKYRDMTIRKRSNIKMIRNLVFFILLIIITFIFIFKDQDINELINAIKSVNIIYVLIACGLMFLTFIMESYNVRCVLIALKEKKLSMLKALKFTWIGFFFSAITPASTGGQPIEVYYMSKENISTANSTMAMLLQLCGFQISAISISIICVILNPSILKDGLIWFYLLGLSLNSIGLTFMMIGIFSKKMTRKIVDLSIKLLRFAKVKNIDKKIEKIEQGLNQYNESSKYIISHKSEFFKSVFRVFIQIILFHSIPYFIYRAFGLNDHTFLEVFSMQAILYTTVSSIPLPGSVGVSETLFLKIYGTVFTNSILSGAMLIFRFISFYLYIIVSAVVVILNAVKMKDVKGQIDKDVKEIENDDIKISSKLVLN
jgi:hypothetical protein